MTTIQKTQQPQIANAYFSGRATVQELAAKYGTTASRIYQIVRAHREQVGIPVQRGPRSERARTAKLTGADAVMVMGLKGRASAREVAAAAGVSQAAIYKVWQGRTWKNARSAVGGG